MKTNHVFSTIKCYAAALLLCSAPLSTRAIEGYAAQNGGTTGGAGGPTVTVTNAKDFEFYVGSHDPFIVQVQGTIDLGGSQATVRENKSIIGLGSNATIIGGLKISHYNNLIVQNLTLRNSNNDGLTVQVSNHVWVDHCTFIDTADGALDITHATEWVTVSWCKFLYTFDHAHNFVNLIGHDDDNGPEDRGTLHITFHHNWWSTLCIERMPRVRFGQVHVYNNYYGAPGNNYCIRAALESQILAENNYFDGVNTPWEYFTLPGQTPGRIRAVGNVFVNSIQPAGGNDSVFTPPYAYTLEAANAVKASVMAGAGAGGGGTGGNTAPAVSLTAPANGASFAAGAAVTVSATASDIDGTVTNVAFFANGAPIGSDTSAPYSITWTPAAAGTYALTAVATDNAGAQTTSAPISVSITSAGNTPPSVSLTAPANGTAFTAGASVTVSASASDSDGTVASVAFFANGAPLGTDTTAPYAITWSNLAAGSYTLTAVATDNAGAQTTSAPVTVTVNNVGGGTTVTLTSLPTEDGRVLESSEGSNSGGSTNSADATADALRTGDDASDRQFKTILSFDTSGIPDGATIVSATLRLRRGSATGINAFTTHGSLLVDLKGGTGFNNSPSVQTGDFQATADATQVATMSAANANGEVSSGALNAAGRSLINKTGKTQLRVYFALDDNDNASADYIGWFSGNDANPANRPVLEITYQ